MLTRNVVHSTGVLSPMLIFSCLLRAKLGGWNVMILSDQFTVRAYSSHEAWKPGPMKVSAGDKTGSGPKSLSSWLSSLNPQLQAQLQEAVASIVSSRHPKSHLLSPFGCRALACGSLHPVAQRGGYVVVIFVKCVTPTANNSLFFRYLSPSPLF